MKININCKITNEEETIQYKTKAIKQDNQIKYIYKDEIYILTIITPKKLILKRSTPQMESTIYFEENKTLKSLYNIKDKNISLKIEIKTKKIKITNKKIEILYTVIDSNTNYKYYIEMSDK